MSAAPDREQDLRIAQVPGVAQAVGELVRARNAARSRRSAGSSAVTAFSNRRAAVARFLESAAARSS